MLLPFESINITCIVKLIFHLPDDLRLRIITPKCGLVFSSYFSFDSFSLSLVLHCIYWASYIPTNILDFSGTFIPYSTMLSGIGMFLGTVVTTDVDVNLGTGRSWYADIGVSICLSIGVAKGADKGVVLYVQSCAKDF